jgi:predicted RNase H-like HicB family nuclease
VSLTLVIELELERESEQRWIADIPALPAVLVYGSTPADAIARIARDTGLRPEDL